MRRRAGIWNGASCDQTRGGRRRRSVQRVEAARPPAAPTIRIRAKIEQRIDHVDIGGGGDDRGRIEAEQRLIDVAAQLLLPGKQAAERRGVAIAHRFLEPVDQRKLFGRD